MKNLHNIEKLAKHHIYYTGYGAGTVWRIYGKTGCWSAYPRNMNLKPICESTLSAISARLCEATK